MQLLVGLGNPGPRYARNRHNIGYMAVDAIVRRHSFQPWRNRFHGQASEGNVDGTKVLAFKPTTFMNESGRAVAEALRFYKLPPSELIVIHDDLDLAPGKVRVKRGGGAGGHNGLRSLDRHIGPDYWRLRVGIGHPGDKLLVHGYVLSDFYKAEEPWVERLLDCLPGEVPRLLGGDHEGFMSRIAHLLQLPKKEKNSDGPSGKDI